MRHGAVAYFDDAGRPVPPETVPLTEEGRAQAEAARELLTGIPFDRVIASSLPRTMETAALVAPGSTSRAVDRPAGDPRPPARLDPGERARRMHSGTRSAASCRTRSASSAASRSTSSSTASSVRSTGCSPTATWDTVLLVLHGAVNRAILSHALTGQRMFLGHFEQAPGCVNILDVGDEWIVRAVNVSPPDLAHRATRMTTMEGYWQSFSRSAPTESAPPMIDLGRPDADGAGDAGPVAVVILPPTRLRLRA